GPRRRSARCRCRRSRWPRTAAGPRRPAPPACPPRARCAGPVNLTACLGMAELGVAVSRAYSHHVTYSVYVQPPREGAVSTGVRLATLCTRDDMVLSRDAVREDTEAVPMAMPLHLTVKLGTYLMKQKVRGVKKYPLIM